MIVLGIWDGHDAGAALLKEGNILFVINEERLTRRKLEVGFPELSIQACLAHVGWTPHDIRHIALSTADPAKTLTRLVPGLKEEYYLIRRRKRAPKALDALKKGFKYRFTELGPTTLTRHFTRMYVKSQLKKLGFGDVFIHLLDHHRCHAEAAAGLSGFDRALVLTLDGVGDGLCGSLWLGKEGGLVLMERLPARVSLGIFFEHVTNLMNMRELEDEGKVMALANYAYPVQDRENPLMDLIHTRGLRFVSPYSSTAMYRELKKILWRYPSEQFAAMAQRVLEERVLTLVKNAVARSGLHRVCLAGGVFSNVKLNMKIEELPEVERVFVVPHMGDGGLALGAAMAAQSLDRFRGPYHWTNPYWGPRFSGNDILSLLPHTGFRYERVEDPAQRAAELILAGQIVLWFRGRMEAGPRALGNRSILARPDSTRIKDRLNLVLKKRVWYQPFCPSILMEDASEILDTAGRNMETNRFMTTAFRVRPAFRDLMEGVINIDGTCRPHLVGDENPPYRDLLRHIRRTLGRGVVLNTSFNIHGDPMVCSPQDALDMFERTQIRYLFLEDFLVDKG